MKSRGAISKSGGNRKDGLVMVPSKSKNPYAKSNRRWKMGETAAGELPLPEGLRDVYTACDQTGESLTRNPLREFNVLHSVKSSLRLLTLEK